MVTGTRAEYGLLRLLMKQIRDQPTLQLQLVATGTHLSPEFGNTYREIEEDGFEIDLKVDMRLDSDTPAGVTRSVGIGTIGFADAFERLGPDIVVMLGDRFELLSAASAALIARIPVAHLHGGESTEGAFDEAIRHAVTKMSHLHFVAAEEYRRRVVQLGEDPARVFLVGGLGVDSIRSLALLDRAALEMSLGMKLGRKNLLVTFHPVTLEAGATAPQMEELLAALGSLDDTTLIFTLPNADTESRALIAMIQEFVTSHPRAHAYASLGQLRYLSCLQFVDGVVGNSSSGLTEVPSFAKGTVNIGDRQRGRLRASSVIEADPDRGAIEGAIRKLYSEDFQATLAGVRNPYGDGGASEKIVRVLVDHPLGDLLKKSFHDVAQ